MDFEEYKRQARAELDKDGRQISDNLLIQMYLSDTTHKNNRENYRGPKETFLQKLFKKK